MRGMDGQTGRAVAGTAHIQQSIREIVTTRVGTRICRRGFGSDLPGLVDMTMDGAARSALSAATIDALRLHEPRVRLRAARVTLTPDGQVTITVDCVVIATGETVSEEVML